MMNTISLFITLAGFVIGLGSVSVIDILGFLGRKSSYWTETTIRTHKVTKPLIWVGILLLLVGQTFMYVEDLISTRDYQIRFSIILALIVNGIFLSFWISPLLLEREKEGRAKEILNMSLQFKIIVSFIVSFIGWWTLAYLFVQSFS